MDMKGIEIRRSAPIIKNAAISAVALSTALGVWETDISVCHINILPYIDHSRKHTATCASSHIDVIVSSPMMTYKLQALRQSCNQLLVERTSDLLGGVVPQVDGGHVVVDAAVAV
jgi:hypothetical protein